jgi:hypothetical protein
MVQFSTGDFAILKTATAMAREFETKYSLR